MSTFIVFPDDSAAGKVRFFDAVIDLRAKVLRSWRGPPVQFLVDTEVNPESFAIACGSRCRPVPTENAGRARPA